MTELRDPGRKVLAATVKALVERHGGPQKVADAVDMHRTSVHRWMNGDITMENLGLLADRLGEQVVVRFGPGHEEAASPGGTLTRRLLTGVLALERKTGVSADELAVAEAEAMVLIAHLLGGSGTPPPQSGGDGAGGASD